MCFSASASFGAGVLLAGIGVTAITKAKASSHKMFAVIPLIFSVQQFTEGFLWLSLTNQHFAIWKEPCMYFFLFFAQMIWPVWVPLSIMLLEKNAMRKRLLLVLTGGGIMLSAELGFFLISYHVDAKIIGFHVMYWIDSPAPLGIITSVFYFFTAVFPPFISSVKKVWLLGVALVASYIITSIYYGDYIISVWCYFAAIISGIILLIILEEKKANRLALKADVAILL